VNLWPPAPVKAHTFHHGSSILAASNSKTSFESPFSNVLFLIQLRSLDPSVTSRNESFFAAKLFLGFYGPRYFYELFLIERSEFNRQRFCNSNSLFPRRFMPLGLSRSKIKEGDSIGDVQLADAITLRDLRLPLVGAPLPLVEEGRSTPLGDPNLQLQDSSSAPQD